MRIELVLWSLARAGMEVVTAELALRLRSRGHDVGVTCTHERGALEPVLTAADIRVSFVESPPIGVGVRQSPLERHFRVIAPDVVHSHSWWLKSALAARRAGVPGRVHTLHGLENDQSFKDRAEMYLGALLTHRGIAVSTSLERYLVDKVRVPKARVQTLVNGVDCARFRPGQERNGFRASLGLADDDVLFGTVARFSPIKDHHTLVSAFGRVVAEQPNAHLALIGGGELKSVVEAQVRDLGLRDHVHFLGVLDDTPPAYRDLDVFVLSSTNEGTSISILEAFATGVPVVATAVGGTPDIVDDGIHGLLVPPGDPVALASAMARLAREPGERQRMSTLARQSAVEHFSLDAMVTAYESVYEAVIRGDKFVRA